MKRHNAKNSNYGEEEKATDISFPRFENERSLVLYVNWAQCSFLFETLSYVMVKKKDNTGIHRLNIEERSKNV